MPRPSFQSCDVARAIRNSIHTDTNGVSYVDTNEFAGKLRSSSTKHYGDSLDKFRDAGGDGKLILTSEEAADLDKTANTIGRDFWNSHVSGSAIKGDLTCNLDRWKFAFQDFSTATKPVEKNENKLVGDTHPLTGEPRADEDTSLRLADLFETEGVRDQPSIGSFGDPRVGTIPLRKEKIEDMLGRNGGFAKTLNDLKESTLKAAPNNLLKLKEYEGSSLSMNNKYSPKDYSKDGVMDSAGQEAYLKTIGSSALRTKRQGILEKLKDDKGNVDVEKFMEECKRAMGNTLEEMFDIASWNMY